MLGAYTIISYKKYYKVKKKEERKQNKKSNKSVNVINKAQLHAFRAEKWVLREKHT